MSDIEAVREIRDRYRADIRALPGVVGTGIGQEAGAACLRVYLDREMAVYARLIPSVEGVPVVWTVTGAVTAVAQSDHQHDGREVVG